MAISKFLETPKIGDEELITFYKDQLEKMIEEKFMMYKHENDEKRDKYISMAETNNLILTNDCGNLYSNLMHDAFSKIDSYFNNSDLMGNHENAKTMAISKFMETPKMGDGDLTMSYKNQLEKMIEEKFMRYKHENDEKRERYIQKANQHNDGLIFDIRSKFMEEIFQKADDFDLDTTAADLERLFTSTKRKAFGELDRNKMGDGDIFSIKRSSLERELNNLISTVTVEFLQKYGWLTIIFEHISAIMLASNVPCDFNPCDSYIKVFINNKLKYNTRVFVNEKYPYYGLIFHSGKIHKKSPIRLELWDYDDFSSDDLILSWDTNVKELLKKREKYGVGGNKIGFEASWVDQKKT